MATGYTHKIKDGITFEQFAMGCARAFGACIEMRDESSDTPIPEKFEPGDYHPKAIAAVQAEMSKVEAMTDSECSLLAEKEFKQSRERIVRYMDESSALADKYKAMLEKIEAYNPPSKDHEEFKKFMLGQVSESLKFDCGGDFHQQELEALRMQTGKRWKKEKLATLKRDIAYHTKEFKEECARAEGRTLWVKQLLDSLKS